jgi:hypothetical protein
MQHIRKRTVNAVHKKKVRDHLEDLGVDEKIILNWILKK